MEDSRSAEGKLSLSWYNGETGDFGDLAEGDGDFCLRGTVTGSSIVGVEDGDGGVGDILSMVFDIELEYCVCSLVL